MTLTRLTCVTGSRRLTRYPTPTNNSLNLWWCKKFNINRRGLSHGWGDNRRLRTNMSVLTQLHRGDQAADNNKSN